MEFAELLSAKLCHDLTGPFGAINNGMEFLNSDDKDVDEKALNLVLFSSNQALHRLSFMRSAYGYMSDSSEMSVSAMKALVLNFFENSKVVIDFKVDEKIEQLDRNTLKLVLNALLIVSASIMYNGRVVIEMHGADNLSIQIEGIGSVVKIEQEIQDILGSTSDVVMTTRNVQCFYIKDLAKAANYKMKLQQIGEKIGFYLSR